MKRKSVSIAIVIAALAVLVNVFALRSASVSNNLSVSITNTTASLIAITGTGLDSDVTFDSSSGQAVISLPTNGLQPGSSYTFFPAFKVKNNSADTKTISVSQGSVPTGVSLSFVDASGAAIGSTSLSSTDPALAVGIKIDVTSAAALGSAPVSVSVGAN